MYAKCKVLFCENETYGTNPLSLVIFQNSHHFIISSTTVFSFVKTYERQFFSNVQRILLKCSETLILFVSNIFVARIHLQ